MRRIVFILLIICLLFSGCNKGKSITAHENVESFDKIVNNEDSIKYDVRDYSVCTAGHISNFMCMRGENNEKSLDDLINNLATYYSKNKVIVIIDADGADSLYMVNQLKEKGYKNLHYFLGGYNSYVSLKGETFIPETGCNC